MISICAVGISFKESLRWNVNSLAEAPVEDIIIPPPLPLSACFATAFCRALADAPPLPAALRLTALLGFSGLLGRPVLSFFFLGGAMAGTSCASAIREQQLCLVMSASEVNRLPQVGQSKSVIKSPPPFESAEWSSFADIASPGIRGSGSGSGDSMPASTAVGETCAFACARRCARREKDRPHCPH